MSKKQTFEAAFQRLEEIARLLEQGEIGLEASVKLYEEGMKLIQFCAGKLDEAETTVMKLSKSGNGDLQTEPFEDGA